MEGKRSYKYSHDKLRKMPDGCIPAELDVWSDDNGNDSDGWGTTIVEER